MIVNDIKIINIETQLIILKIKTVFDLISISCNDIIYFTSSTLPDLQEECKIVE